MRRLIAHIARLLYKSKYKSLHKRLIEEYKILCTTNNSNYETLSKLLISGEDHRFHYHIGFDIIAVFRAVKIRVFWGKIEGASTIEQQLVRVLTNNFDKTLQRKIQEIFLATTLSSILPKKIIPSIYLNVAYYGTDMNGLSQAMGRLKIREQEKLPIEKAAEIVSRIKYPEPKVYSLKRVTQIEIRKKHLIVLYNKHLRRKYFKIYG